MNTSTTSKQLSTANIAAPTKGTREENTTKATNLSSLVTSANSSSASPQLANNFGTTSQVRPSGLIAKYDSLQRSRDLLLSPSTVAIIAFAITATAVVFIFLIVGIRQKRRQHHNVNERSMTNSFQQVTFRSIPRHVAGDISLLGSKRDDSITFHPICHPDEGANKSETVPLQGDDTDLSSAMAADLEVYGSQRELKQRENHATPTSPEVIDEGEQRRRRHPGAGTQNIDDI